MREIIVFGAGGFIGTNLIKILSKNPENHILAIDKSEVQLKTIIEHKFSNVETYLMDFNDVEAYEKILNKQDYLFHLISTTIPTTSNLNIPRELEENVISTYHLLNECIKKGIGRVVFLSSGGTVYGKDKECPLKEDFPLAPINSYGMQKMMIETLLYIYKYQFGLDYKVIRLSNPYGPYQRTDGVQGVISTFVYKALQDEDIIIYGDGSVVRDYIYISDAILAILNIAFSDRGFDIYNVGSGVGVTITQVVDIIKDVIPTKSSIIYKEGRNVDVPVNFLDICRYESIFGKMSLNSLKSGIEKTVEFFKTGNYQV